MRKLRWIALAVAAYLGAGSPLAAQSPYGQLDQPPAPLSTGVSVRPASLGSPVAAPAQAPAVFGAQAYPTQLGAPGAGGLPAPNGQPGGTGGGVEGEGPGAGPGSGAPGGEGSIEPGSRLEQQAQQLSAERLGPTPPEDVKLFMGTALGKWLEPSGVRMYGWVDSGYTYASTGHGILNVEPRENRFGREYLLNQLALVLDKPLDSKKSDEFQLGFKSLFYSGADAALLRPRGGFTTTDPRFGADFRDLYVSAHLPILSEGGVDVKAGRMTSIIGYESAMAPYRPFYSNAYEWFYSEDGAFTGLLATWYATKQLDITAGVTLGANTFFTLRGDGPCFIGQVNYWLQESKKTLLSASVYLGDQAVFAAPGKTGEFVTMIELRLQQNWNKYLTQVVQSNDGWESSIPGVGTGEWYSLYNIFIVHASKTLDLTNRVEWFDDVQGTRTGFRANYNEVTVGMDWHPLKYLRLRPEVRGDFADHRVFGVNGNPQTHSQLTAAFDVLFSF